MIVFYSSNYILIQCIGLLICYYILHEKILISLGLSVCRAYTTKQGLHYVKNMFEFLLGFEPALLNPKSVGTNTN